jgi:L-seryl-tRNA(Ser) seleniumtransferase
VKPGETVVGISPSYSHPTVIRSAQQVGAKFVDTKGIEDFGKTLENEKNVSLVVLTRLPVTYDILDIEEVSSAVSLAKSKGLKIYVDDAGGARVAPAIFGQPRSLELGAEIVATGLDKYGTFGPRFGLLGGNKELVSKIRGKAWEFGLEARPIFYNAILNSLKSYNPKRVVELVNTTKQVGLELKKLLGNYVYETPITTQIRAFDLLELIMKQGGVKEPTIMPIEATAALSMILLRDYGIVTVHFAGVPPGTSSTLFKFISPEILAKFGGAKKFAEAIDSSITKLSVMVKDPIEIQKLLLRTI